MRFATVEIDGRWAVAVVRGDEYLPLPADDAWFRSLRIMAAGGAAAVAAARDWCAARGDGAWQPMAEATLGPAIPDPGAIYTIGANYRADAEPERERPDRPMVLGKLPSSVVGHRATVHWDRSITSNVDGECELGLVIGAHAFDVTPEDAMGHVFGYTIVNDLNSVDPWLDGPNWLLGKSMAGFCPLGPWIVTADELDPSDVGLGCTIADDPIQDGRTSQMRFPIPEIVSYLSRHIELRPGDVIATGTPVRSSATEGRHLEPGDVVTCWIEGIGELTNTIA